MARGSPTPGSSPVPPPAGYLRCPKAPLAALARGGSLRAAARGSRSVYFGEGLGWVDTPVYARAALPVEVRIAGPAVIEEMSSTVALAPGRHARVDRIGNIVVNVRSEGNGERA